MNPSQELIQQEGHSSTAEASTMVAEVEQGQILGVHQSQVRIHLWRSHGRIGGQHEAETHHN